MRQTKNKVLLVYPSAQGEDFPEIPLPLLYIAQALIAKGFDPEIFDMRLEDYHKVDPAKYLFVGLTTMTGPMINEALKFARFARLKSPDTPLVWGGIYPSILPEQTLEDPRVDFIIKGEGEVACQEFAEALRDGADFTRIKGLGYKLDGKPVVNETGAFLDLDTIDIDLPYHLIDMPKYARHSFPIHTSRGCPFRCSFCYNLSFNKRRWRAKSAKKVVDEIVMVRERYGITNISFTWEDEFFINKHRVREICEEIVRRDVKITWDAFCHFNNFVRLDEDFIRLIEKAGCASLSFGGESGSQRILDEVIQKDSKIESMIKSAEMLAKTNIRQIISFMSGVPTETEEDMRMTYELMDKLLKINPNVYFNGIFLYSPYPGTPLFDVIVNKFGYKMPKSLEEWGKFKIYRNTEGVDWHPKSYLNKYRLISILTRFPFYKPSFKFSDVRAVLAGERFGHFPYNIVYYIYAKIARFRWVRKDFRFPIEWLLLEKVMEKVRGFV